MPDHHMQDVKKENKMKNLSILAILIACLFCIAMTACPTKPKEKPEPPKGTAPTATEPIPTPVMPPSGAGTESVVKDENGNVTATVGKAGENDPRILAMFKKYTSWPPTSISKEDVALLNKAVVVLETSKGIIKIRVFPDQAPLNSANFVKLASDGFYNGIVFHRVMKGFMSQGGDPTGTGMGGPTPDYTIPAEIGLPHEAGSLAAARTGGPGNPQKRGSGSQFYLCHSKEGCERLNGDYTVYGKITEGQDVNLALTVTYDAQSRPIPGVKPDKIVKAWVEVH
jgi:peptidyl-prolyl cis-trans isomerase B (cyclophilin B)